jgi:hypothetical protein
VARAYEAIAVIQERSDSYLNCAYDCGYVTEGSVYMNLVAYRTLSGPLGSQFQGRGVNPWISEKKNHAINKQ